MILLPAQGPEIVDGAVQADASVIAVQVAEEEEVVVEVGGGVLAVLLGAVEVRKFLSYLLAEHVA